MLERGVKNKSDPDSSLEPEAKRSRTEPTQSEVSTSPVPKLPESSQISPGLLTLSDDVILHILSFVGPSDLLSLGECGDRLSNITKDKSLWRICDLRPRILSLNRLHAVLHWLQPVTTVFACCGPVEIMPPPKEGEMDEPTWLLSFMILLCKYAPNLKTLIIENHILDCNKILIEDFPPTIESLSLKSCIFNNVPKQSSYFFGIHTSLSRLKELDLTDSSWFVPHSLLALSKCNMLEKLVLYGCDISECMPYASLAANFGFPSLTLLDLRCTPVSDVEVTCFNKMTSLRHLFISAPEELFPHPSPFSYHVGCGFGSNAVTDQSITTFGNSPAIVRHVIDRRDMQRRVLVTSPCLLETLLLNGYERITDLTLQHVSASMANLKVLDVVRTGVSRSGLFKFKSERPLVTLISDFKLDA